MANPSSLFPRPEQGDIVELILDDHRRFESLLRDLRNDQNDRDALRRQIAELLVAHGEAEESEVYPQLAELDEQMAADAETEHSEARDGLAALKEQIGQPGFAAALETLKGGIQHHVQEEEGQTFPKLRASAAST